MPTILDAEKLAEALQIHPESVRRLTRDGTLPYYRIGGTIRYSLEDVLALTRVSTHQDDESVDLFCQAMHLRMATCREEGKEGWSECPVDQLWALLERSVGKRMPVDVGNYAMMIFAQEKARGASGLNV